MERLLNFEVIWTQQKVNRFCGRLDEICYCLYMIKFLLADNDSSLHTQLWIDPKEEFLQYIHNGDPVDVTFSVKELKVMYAMLSTYCFIGIAVT